MSTVASGAAMPARTIASIRSDWWEPVVLDLRRDGRRCSELIAADEARFLDRARTRSCVVSDHVTTR